MQDQWESRCEDDDARFAAAAIELELIDEDALEHALEYQRDYVPEWPLSRLLVETGMLTEAEAWAVARTLGLNVEQ